MIECPGCGNTGVHWSDPTVGGYGWGCLDCKLFFFNGDSGVVSIPLSHAHFPPRFRTVPAYCAAAGWTMPSEPLDPSVGVSGQTHNT